MNRALYAAASGMAAQEINLDIIADNLANADIAGFKGATATFTEAKIPGEGAVGTVLRGTHVLFEQGKLEKSGGAFDLGIDGPGFFVVTDEHGHRTFTRDGAFSRATDGTLRDAHGDRLNAELPDRHFGPVRVPEDALTLHVDERGTIVAQMPHGQRTLGHLRLAEFAAPDALARAGGTRFRATPECGAMHLVAPGTENGPSVRFGVLEHANVSIIEAMMQILAAQRAYEANAKGVQAADELMRIADNLSRS